MRQRRSSLRHDFPRLQRAVALLGAAVGLALLPVASSHSTVVSDTLTADEFELTASDGAPANIFGDSVSIAGDTAVVGAPGDDDNGSRSGSAYVFERMGGVWAEMGKLTASDGAKSDRLGNSVSISGDTAVVGAPGDDDNGTGSGSAYVFERMGGVWGELAELTASDGAADDFFGSSVSVSGDTALVGAPFDDDNGDNSGSAYVFERVFGGAWMEVAKLTATGGAADALFGRSVSVSGDTAVIGARFDDDKGAAYVFERVGGAWVEAAKLTATDGAAGDFFGDSVAVSDDTAVVGAPGDADNGLGSGSAYLFEKEGGSWTEVAKLLASDGAAHDAFGNSVSASEDNVVVGARSDDDNGSRSGSAYLFQKKGGNWTEVAKLLASDGEARDVFGDSVAVSGNVILIGRPADAEKRRAIPPGSAWVFEIPEPTPEERIQDMIGETEDLVAEGTLNRGQGNSLAKKLDNALMSLDKGNDDDAINQLAAFANQVQAYINSRKLTQAQGQSLIDEANSIIDQILMG